MARAVGYLSGGLHLLSEQTVEGAHEVVRSSKARRSRVTGRYTITITITTITITTTITTTTTTIILISIIVVIIGSSLGSSHSGPKGKVHSPQSQGVLIVPV